MSSLDNLCRICSDQLDDDAAGIFSAECMEDLIGEKIRRYLYFSVSIKDNLPKKVCNVCLKKLHNIHRFAKMAAEMQEKFRMLLLQDENAKPKIKLRSIQDLSNEVKENDPPLVNGNAEKHNEEMEMSFEASIEEAGVNEEEVGVEDAPVSEDCEVIDLPGGNVAIKTENTVEGEEEEEEDEDKPNLSLLHSLLIKGKARLSMDVDHDYTADIKSETIIKEETEDPEDEDIAEEIEEDRLNQIIKEEMADTDDEDEEENEDSVGSDVEITEMEVKVDPMLYFSNSQSGNEVEQDSMDGESPSKKKPTPSKGPVNGSASLPNSHLVMTRSQQRSNPVIASLKLGKPYKCTVCPRSFITDIGLQNHLWSHLPKSRKAGGSSQVMVHKNVDLEDSQVYSSNGVLHTALPSENPHLLKYVCPICGKKISTKGNLKVHLETHRPKGKYGCDICGRVFKTAANLYRHKDYHGGVQFPCHVCGRVYPTNSTLRAHSITHSDLRPHQCPLCNKTFKRNQDLKFHINQHTGARPYQCPYCPKAFASSGNCFSHRKRMHPMEVERDKERAAEIMG